MIKYSTRGLVKSWSKEYNLFNLLYITSFFTWSSGFYISSLIKYITLFNEIEQSDQTVRRMKTKVGVGFVFLLIFLMMFLGVKYDKQKRPIVCKIQYNILTFDQSFYLYVLYFLYDLALMLFKVYSKGPEKSTRIALILTFFFKFIFFHCIIPLLITWNLKQCMPLLFSDCYPKTEVNNFYISVLSISPRRQNFLPLKKFVAKARWGSEAKFRTMNVDLPHTNLAPVDI